jgi:CBS domain-containing protein
VAMAREFDPQTLRVGDIMVSDPATARTNDSMYDVMNMMRERGVRRIPVTTEKGVLVGIVTLDDLLEIVAEQMQAFVMAVRTEHRRETRTRV